MGLREKPKTLCAASPSQLTSAGLLSFPICPRFLSATALCAVDQEGDERYMHPNEQAHREWAKIIFDDIENTRNM